MSRSIGWPALALRVLWTWALTRALTRQDKNPDNRERAAEKFKEVLVSCSVCSPCCHG